MSPTRKRDKTSRLAMQDPGAALDFARSIKDPWYRCQAPAKVARYAPEAELLAIAAEAFDSARHGKDTYQIVAVSAWPLRALVERASVGELFAVQCTELRVLADKVQPRSSQSEALFLVFQAVYPAGRDAWLPMFEALRAACDPATHWRQARTLRDALAIVAGEDGELVARVVAELPEGKVKRRILIELQKDSAAAPRPFFW